MCRRNRYSTSNQMMTATVSFPKGSWFGKVTYLWLILREFITLRGQDYSPPLISVKLQINPTCFFVPVAYFPSWSECLKADTRQ